jgi:2-methylisocitrate lyase-like PEP mutase family enzyme
VPLADSPARRLRELVVAPEILVLPGAQNALSALVIAQAGFEAVYVTGAGWRTRSWASLTWPC